VGLDHHIDTPHTLSKQLVVVVAHLVAQSLVVRRGSVHVLYPLPEETGYFTKHPLAVALLGTPSQFCCEGHPLSDQALHIVKPVFFISEVTLHKGIDELLLSLAKLGVLIR
jgi:hypothetical protein